MDCPNCGLVNPPEAQRCDCGYDFVEGCVPESRPRRPAQRRATGEIAFDFDLDDAADASEVWDNCDLLGCPPDCNGLH